MLDSVQVFNEIYRKNQDLSFNQTLVQTNGEIHNQLTYEILHQIWRKVRVEVRNQHRVYSHAY